MVIKKGLKITLIILGVLVLLLATFFFAKSHYQKNRDEFVANPIYSENHTQNEWKTICKKENGLKEIYCFIAGSFNLIQYNRSISESFCKEISSDKITTPDKIFYASYDSETVEDIKNIQKKCLTYANKN